MPAIPEGKIICPVCGAKSKTDGFGKESFRSVTNKRSALSSDPTIAKRRAKSNAIRSQNRGARV